MMFRYPGGMIMAFETVCPSGWTRVDAFDSNFLRGADTYGGTGGNTTHSHSFNPPSRSSGISQVHPSDWGSNEISHLNQHTHSINLPSTTSGSADHTPPYMNVVFCKKD